MIIMNTSMLYQKHRQSIFALLLIFLLAPQYSFAQQEVGIPFTKKNVFLLEFAEPYETVRIDIGKNEFGSDEIIDAKLIDGVTLMDHDENIIAPGNIYTGMEMVVEGEKLRNGFVVTSIKLTTKIDDWSVKLSGVYESYDPATNIAEVAGQRVMLTEGTQIKGDGPWRKKKDFPSFNNMMLGSFTDVQGRRGTDGVVYIEAGKTRPNLHGDSERALKLALQLVVKQLDDSGELVVGIDTYKLIENAELQQYVQSLGELLVPQWINDLPEAEKINFTFHVIDDPAFNAMALPDGTILVHTGLLKKISNEAQLAAILGHEIAHVTNEHGMIRFEKERKKRRTKGMLEDAKNLFSIAGERIDVPETVEVGDVVVNMDMVLKVGEGALSNIYSREQEDQADKVGLNYAVKAGYDPREAAVVWKMLADNVDINSLDQEDAGSITERLRERTNSFLYSSHSHALERFKHINREIATNYYTMDFSTFVKGEESYMQLGR